MGAADGATIECPTCHFEVAPGLRCALCGSPLPAFVPSPPGSDTGGQVTPEAPEPPQPLPPEPPEPEPPEPVLPPASHPPNWELEPLLPVPALADIQVSESRGEGPAPAPPAPQPAPEKVAAADAAPAAVPEEARADTELPVPDPVLEPLPRPERGPIFPERPDPGATGQGPAGNSGGGPGAGDPGPGAGPGPATTPIHPPRLVATGGNDLARRLVFDFQFAGRMARPAYWKMFAIRAGIVLLCLVLAVADMGEGETGAEPGLIGVLAGVAMIVVAVCGLAEASRRLHDTGKSGWWNLLLLIPYVGFLGLVFLLAQPGTPNDNQFGPAPDALSGA